MTDEFRPKWEPPLEGYTRDAPLDEEPEVGYEVQVNVPALLLVVGALGALIGVFVPIAIKMWEWAL
jgi:hypothetical protein